MNLKKFFAMKNAPPRAACVSVGTDGLSPERSNIMSVSVYIPGMDPETTYIRGADAEKVEEYTGVCPEKYADEAVGIARATEILEEKDWPELVVSYQVNRFTRPWLFTAFPSMFRAGTHTWLDVLSYIKYVDDGNPFPVEAESIGEVCGEVNRTRGIKFDEAVATRLPKPDAFDDLEELSTLEQRIHYLRKLWEYCLEKEL